MHQDSENSGVERVPGNNKGSSGQSSEVLEELASLVHRPPEADSIEPLIRPRSDGMPRVLDAPLLASRNKKIWIIASLILIFFAVCIYISTGPRNFEAHSVAIVKGSSLGDAATTLKKENIIRSALLFRVLVIARGKAHSVIAGDYLFDGPQSIATVVSRLTAGETGQSAEKVTIPEGTTTAAIALIVKRQISDFDTVGFLKIAQQKEGYLFPDTYFFNHVITPEEVVEHMSENFEVKIADLAKKIETSGKPLKDVLIMASLIEGEARTAETRKIISGILWKRLKIGMALQVDAAFQYINGKSSSELTVDDLNIDSPYNTYKYPGLPPTPISNPGTDAIIAALEPEESKYFYYLSDEEGAMHYAVTLEEHVMNKEKYLR